MRTIRQMDFVQWKCGGYLRWGGAKDDVGEKIWWPKRMFMKLRHIECIWSCGANRAIPNGEIIQWEYWSLPTLNNSRSPDIDIEWILVGATTIDSSLHFVQSAILSNGSAIVQLYGGRGVDAGATEQRKVFFYFLSLCETCHPSVKFSFCFSLMDFERSHTIGRASEVTRSHIVINEECNDVIVTLSVVHIILIHEQICFSDFSFAILVFSVHRGVFNSIRCVRILS